jgi:hypothetical protein
MASHLGDLPEAAATLRALAAQPTTLPELRSRIQALLQRL